MGSRKFREIKPIEYIYLLDKTWKPGKIGSVPFEYGTIVVNVRHDQDKDFMFESKETGATFCTYYDWALVENTPENVELLRQLEEQKQIVKAEELKLENIRKQIKSLKIYGESESETETCSER